MNPAQPNLPVVAFDTETHRIALGQLAPPLVCLSAALRESPAHEPQTVLYGRQEEADLRCTINWLLAGDKRIVNQRTAFDLAVIAAAYPDLIPAIFRLLEAELVEDIAIREKMLALANTGDIEYINNPDGTKSKREYSLMALVKHHFGVDLTDTKDSDDAWRTNYALLEHLPVDQWPLEAVKYAKDDAIWPLRIYEVQEQQRAELAARIGRDPLKTSAYRTAIDFALQLVSAWGLCTDGPEVLKLEEHYNQLRSLDRLPLLRDYGIISPEIPGRPHAKGTRNHVEGCDKKNCSCPVKMTDAVPEKKNMAKLQAYVLELSARNPAVVIKKTPPSDKFPEGQISVDAEFLEDYSHLDPILAQLKERGEHEKMVSTEIPRMMMRDEKGESVPGHPAPFIHPRFDVLKETGRTSSYGDKALPSANVQNVDPRARTVYVARPGYVLFSVDYSQMELGTLAQTCYSLFGHSKMRDLINAGVDLHAWLGAQIAMEANPEFKAWVLGTNAQTRDDFYHCFVMCKESQDPAVREMYEHFRKLAKPTGLGYPGGLGAETFVAYAKATYGVVIDVTTAEMLRRVWKESFPEMEEYFAWINESCIDPQNPKLTIKDKKTGQHKTVTGYAYCTPMGLHRAGAVYCAAANGIGLQSPSAEGALMGLFNVVRACVDPMMGSILCDNAEGVLTRVLAFIHDENLGETRDDGHAHDRVMEIARIMEAAMRVITPDVNVKAQPCLMRRWSKDAKPVYDANKRLIPWEPKAQEPVPAMAAAA